MKTRIIIAALSGLALLSACDNSENTDADMQNASSETAPGNSSDESANTPVKNIDESDIQSMDREAIESHSDNVDLPGAENDEFNEETGHYEEDGSEAYPDDPMMEEDAGVETSPPAEVNSKSMRNDAAGKQ